MNFSSIPKSRSLSNRLALSLAVVLIFFGSASLLLYSYLSSYQANLDLDGKSREYLKTISETLALPIWDVDEPKIKAICSAYAENNFIGKINVTGADGYLYFSRTKPDTTILKEKSTPIEVNGEKMGELTLAFSSDYHHLLQRRFFGFYAISLFLMILALTIIVNILLRKLLKRPFTEFINMVESYSTGNGEVFKGQSSFVEFKPLVTVLKNMGNTIKQQIRSLKFTQYAIDQSVISTYWFDQRGHVVYANESASRASGFTRAEILNCSIKDLIYHGPLFEKTGALHFPENAKPIFFESCQCKKDGTKFPVEVAANFFRYHQENFIFAFVTDIRERKKAEAALRKSEDKYRTMIESMTDPVSICAPEYKIEFMNTAMIQRIGRDAAGEICYKALHNLEKKCDWCTFDRLKTGEILESNIVSPKDSRSFRVTNIPIKTKNGSFSKLSIYRDVTEYLTVLEEKEKTRSRLFQAQKMEALGNLAGGIAHDFNNLLSVIFGYSELAINKMDERRKVEGYLQEILAASRRAKDLVNQILAFARQTEDESKPVQISLIIKEVIKFIRLYIPSTIEIRHCIKSESLVMGNPGMIHQVLMNLCTNAAHAMETKGGVLDIRLKDVEIDQPLSRRILSIKPGNYIEISVSDTGEGISPGIIGSIFDPYFTTKEAGKGTGLGLSMVHGIVQGYGGRILVDSKLGEGSVFTIYLPAMETRKTCRSIQTEDMPTGTETILIVDDEVEIAKVSGLFLEQLGYSVFTQTCSMEALALFRSNPNAIDLVITDMTMPVLTGEKLATEILASRQDIPVILCTGYSSRVSDQNFKEFGIAGFMFKPVVMADLARMVRKLLDDFNTGAPIQ